MIMPSTLSATILPLYYLTRYYCTFYYLVRYYCAHYYPTRNEENMKISARYHIEEENKFALLQRMSLQNKRATKRRKFED